MGEREGRGERGGRGMGDAAATYAAHAEERRFGTPGADTGDPSAPYLQTLDEYARDPRDAQTEGAVLLLLGVSLAIGSSMLWGDYGGVTCTRRLTYSPDKRAFGVAWFTIWSWLFVSIFAQLGGAALQWEDVRPSFVANAITGTAHALLAPWAYFFGAYDAPDHRRSFALAAVLLTSSAALAVAGLAEAAVLRGRERSAAQFLLVAVPYALFAGWLCIASALNIGILALQAYRPHSPRRALVVDEVPGTLDAPPRPCAPRPRYSILTAAPPGFESRVPLLLAAVVGAFALAVPSPVLPVPAVWAVSNMYGSRWSRAALLVALVSIGAAAALVGLDAYA